MSTLADTPEYFEDTSFVVGDSPVTLDLRAALGRNATSVTVLCDGAGNFTVAFSVDGIAYGDAILIKNSESLSFSDMSVATVRIAWVSDSSYRVIAI